MRVTALGVNSAFGTGKTVVVDDKGTKAYIPKFQANFLLEFKTKGKISDEVYRVVLDFGSDIRHSLHFSAELRITDIDAWYCSHPHADHIGGVEGIALMTLFNPFYTPAKKEFLKDKVDIIDYLFNGDKLPPDCKPDMYGHSEVLQELWKAASPGLQTLQGVMKVSIDTYFNPIIMRTNMSKEIKDGDRKWIFYTIESTHVVSGTAHMPSYGLMFESSDGKFIYFPTDTLLMMPPTMEAFYRKASVIYQDCETGFRSGVHSHIDDIRKVDNNVKKKCFLYHYNEEPVVDKDEFKGILRLGDVHEY